MNIRIVVKRVPMKTALRDYAEDKIAASLQRFEDRIHSVTAHFEDVNGPRKRGLDKECRLKARLSPSGEVVVKECSEDMQVAFLTGLDRLKAAISRKAGKAKRGVGAG
ncbi:MAG TPA: HPF/RaiA family ribosome-associated protein [Phycisphaerae bacterium]|nr:HPF/RaiA family ribosome-associated protein [Phycisphaerae bacterium]